MLLVIDRVKERDTIRVTISQTISLYYKSNYRSSNKSNTISILRVDYELTRRVTISVPMHYCIHLFILVQKYEGDTRIVWP